MAADASRLAFVFVCHGGELEIKALLLAASLREAFGDAPELVAAVPQPAQVWGAPSAPALRMLQRLGVGVQEVKNPIGPEYPIGNKLACFCVAARAASVAVLDSDILCLRDFAFDPAAATGFAAKPADKRTFPGGAEVWQPLYAAAGVDLPDAQVVTTFSGEAGPPYFNSGVVFTSAPACLGTAWVECARVLNPLLEALGQRHWLDQVALPIAVRRCGMDFTVLDEDWNYPAHLRRLDSARPYFCHYHWPSVICGEPQLRLCVCGLAARHPELRDVILAHPDWSGVLGG